MRRLVALAFLVGSVLIAVRFYQPMVPNATEMDYLRAAVAPVLIPFTVIDVPTAHNIQLVRDNNRSVLQLSLYPGQPLLHGGVRSEISIDYPFREGDTVVYEWDIRLVSPFPADAQRRWWLLADWHDQPDRAHGQTWDGFPSHSPPILISYGELDGQPLIGVSYGPQQTPVGQFAIHYDQWEHVRAEIHWSQGGDGWLRMTTNDDENTAVVAHGTNMLNGFQHYLKIGLYRQADIRLDNRIQITGVAIHHTLMWISVERSCGLANWTCRPAFNS